MNRSHGGFARTMAGLMAVLLIAGTMPTTGFAQSLLVDPIALGKSGTSSCGGPNQPECGFAKATKQGAHTTDKSCPGDSFFDPLTYGGSCWTCPEHYTRSAKPVKDAAACWRPAHPEYIAAVRHTTGTIWPHECWNIGTFWDGYDSGGCWTCPSGYMRGTAHIADNEACWRDSGHQESPATLEVVKGCPAKAPGQILPDGNPFHDPIDGGTCWTCPPFSERTWTAVTHDNACDVGFTWTSPKYPEPGLFGLDGAVEVITALLQDPQDITDYLYVLAKEGKVAPEERPAWVAAQWAEIKAAPQNSSVLSALASLQVIQAAAEMDDLDDSDPAKRLAKAFAQYVRDRRTFVMQDALQMYDVWKGGVDYQRTLHPQNIGDLFYIGTPPPDFLRHAQDDWLRTTAGATLAVGVLGASVSAAAFSANIPSTIVFNAKAFTDASSGLAAVFSQAAEAASGGAAAATGVIASAAAVMVGTTIILAVSAAILSAAIDLVVKAETARTTLVEHLDAAKTPVDIATFVNDSEAFAHYWALATAGDAAVCANPTGNLALACIPYAERLQTIGGAVNTAFQIVTLNNFLPSFAAFPSITSAAGATFPPSTASVFTITTSGTTPKITLDGTLPGGLTFTDNGDGTAKISGTPAATARGVFTLTVKAVNDVGAATQTFRLTVGTPPSFTSVPTLVFTEGLPAAFTIGTAGDPKPTLNIYDPNEIRACDLKTGICSGPSDGRGNLPSGVTFQANADGTATISGIPVPGTGNSSGSTVPFGGRLEARNSVGTVTRDVTVAVQSPPVTTLGPAKVWIGLKNNDDIGLRVDLMAEVFLKTGTEETRIAQGRLDNQSAGSSGFAKAVLSTIPLSMTGAPVLVPAGAELEFRVSARRTCSGGGPASGALLLWYDGRAIDNGTMRDAGSRFGATRGERIPTSFALRSGLVLSETAGTARTSVAVFVDNKESCAAGRGYVPFGTWTTAIP